MLAYNELGTLMRVTSSNGSFQKYRQPLVPALVNLNNKPVLPEFEQLEKELETLTQSLAEEVAQANQGREGVPTSAQTTVSLTYLRSYNC